MRKIIITVFVAVMALCSIMIAGKVVSSPMDEAIRENIEALTDNEVPYDQPVWERYYRNDLEYNCSKPGEETC